MMERRGAEAQAVYGELLARDDQDMAAAAGLASSLMLTEQYAESVAAYEAVTGRADADAVDFQRRRGSGHDGGRCPEGGIFLSGGIAPYTP